MGYQHNRNVGRAVAVSLAASKKCDRSNGLVIPSILDIRLGNTTCECDRRVSIAPSTPPGVYMLEEHDRPE